MKEAQEVHARGCMDARRKYAQAFVDATGQEIQECEFTTEYLREPVPQKRYWTGLLTVMSKVNHEHQDGFGTGRITERNLKLSCEFRTLTYIRRITNDKMGHKRIFDERNTRSA